jgi:hypothetical protein
VALITVFSLVTLIYAIPPARDGFQYGWDAVVYTAAARAWLDGGNPWNAYGGTIVYAAPPPSFLPYVPFIWMSDALVSITWIGLAAASAIYCIRALHLRMWWLLFPPVSLAIMAGSSALPVMALLVRGGTVFEGLAVLFRVYSAVPLAVLLRFRSLVAAAAFLGTSLLVLPWGTWIAEQERWRASLDNQSWNMSTLSAPVLIPVAIVSLILLGRKRAAWLIVPALWPESQLYYGVIALPVVATMPFVALALAIPVPGLIAIGLAGQVVAERWRGFRRSEVSPDPGLLG